MSDAIATEVTPDGTRRAVTRAWVPEAPVALEFNGLAYAVMMASPLDLEDFATGFALTEGLAANSGEVRDIAVAEVENGWVVRTALTGLGVAKLTERVRARVAESSCGLCGIENLAEVMAHPRLSFVHGDIRDAALMREVVSEVDVIVNAAAESHVTPAPLPGTALTSWSAMTSRTGPPRSGFRPV